jgi:hypothetical protein
MKNTNQTAIMKKILCLAAGLLALNVTTGFGQTPPTPPVPLIAPTLGRAARPAPPTAFDPYASKSEKSELTKFNLDFPGGTPKQLVAAIEKAMGKQLNVIVSTDEKSAKAVLPPIKVSEMDLVRLFNTLRENTKKYGGRNDNDLISQAGFFTLDGNPSDNSLWTFSVYEKQPALTLFSLDFSGGPPELLVKAIEKATGKPLNVIIPTEGADVDLPPIKMNNVDVQRLFSALEVASVKQVQVASGYYQGGFGGGGRSPMQSYQTYNTSYGFKTDGAINDNSVWYFHADTPPKPQVVVVEKTSQFYSLADYLEAGLTVDDITTVIQNGWKMAGVNPTPELKYHKETKLLMAYGEPEKMATIDNVLKVLKPKEARSRFGSRFRTEIPSNQTNSVDAAKTSEENSAK